MHISTYRGKIRKRKLEKKLQTNCFSDGWPPIFGNIITAF